MKKTSFAFRKRKFLRNQCLYITYSRHSFFVTSLYSTYGDFPQNDLKISRKPPLAPNNKKGIGGLCPNRATVRHWKRAYSGFLLRSLAKETVTAVAARNVRRNPTGNSRTTLILPPVA